MKVQKKTLFMTFLDTSIQSHAEEMNCPIWFKFELSLSLIAVIRKTYTFPPYRSVRKSKRIENAGKS